MSWGWKPGWNGSIEVLSVVYGLFIQNQAEIWRSDEKCRFKLRRNELPTGASNCDWFVKWAISPWSCSKPTCRVLEQQRSARLFFYKSPWDPHNLNFGGTNNEQSMRLSEIVSTWMTPLDRKVIVWWYIVHGFLFVTPCWRYSNTSQERNWHFNQDLPKII